MVHSSFCAICSPLTHCALHSKSAIPGATKPRKLVSSQGLGVAWHHRLPGQTSTTSRNLTGDNEESNAGSRKVRGISTANISQSKKEKWSEQHSQWEAENPPRTCAHMPRMLCGSGAFAARFPRRSERSLHSRRSKCRDAYLTRANIPTFHHDAAQQPPSIFTPGVPLSRSTAQNSPTASKPSNVLLEIESDTLTCRFSLILPSVSSDRLPDAN